MDPVKILPTEVFEKVLLFVDVFTLASCSLVSQKWNIAANNDALWKNLCLQNAWLDCGSLEMYVNQMKFLSPDKRAAFHNMSSWKKHYVLRNQINNNWRLGEKRDLFFCPVGFGLITCGACDGRSLAFGFYNGVIKIHDMENENGDFFPDISALPLAVQQLEVAGKYVLVVQHTYLLVYKLKEDRTSYQLISIKLLDDESKVTNVDTASLEQIRSYVTEVAPLIGSPINNIIYHIDENYLIVPSSNHSINVYKLASDMNEPCVNIEWAATSKDSRLVCLHIAYDVVYFVVASDMNCNEETEKMHLHAFSLASQSSQYVSFLAEDTCHPDRNMYNLQTNKMYVVVRLKDYWTILVERQTGQLLIHDQCHVFLNANANPRMIGVSYDDSLQITDPITRSHDFCMTFMSTPIAMYSDFIVTLGVEYDRHGNSTTEIEFWNTETAEMEEEKSLKLQILPNRLAYSDLTKLVFFCEQFGFVVRSFIN